MPPNRLKILHPTGITGLFKFVSNDNHDYTGSLRGTEYGIFRISEVGTVKPTETPSTSAAFKFLRDGVASGNIFTLHSFSGHTTFNFLSRDVPYNTHVDLPTNKCNLMTSHAKLSQVSKFPGNMSVKNLSDYDQYGNKEIDPKWPFRMKLLPNNPSGCSNSDDFQVYFDVLPPCIPVGFKLFDVFAMDEPQELGGTEIQIGYFETTSEVVKSMYGDTKLYFRHQRFEEDLAERPQWRQWV